MPPRKTRSLATAGSKRKAAEDLVAEAVTNAAVDEAAPNTTKRGRRATKTATAKATDATSEEKDNTAAPAKRGGRRGAKADDGDDDATSTSASASASNSGISNRSTSDAKRDRDSVIALIRSSGFDERIAGLIHAYGSEAYSVVMSLSGYGAVHGRSQSGYTGSLLLWHTPGTWTRHSSDATAVNDERLLIPDEPLRPVSRVTSYGMQVLGDAAVSSYLCCDEDSQAMWCYDVRARTVVSRLAGAVNMFGGPQHTALWGDVGTGKTFAADVTRGMEADATRIHNWVLPADAPRVAYVDPNDESGQKKKKGAKPGPPPPPPKPDVPLTAELNGALVVTPPFGSFHVLPDAGGGVSLIGTTAWGNASGGGLWGPAKLEDSGIVRYAPVTRPAHGASASASAAAAPASTTTTWREVHRCNAKLTASSRVKPFYLPATKWHLFQVLPRPQGPDMYAPSEPALYDHCQVMCGVTGQVLVPLLPGEREYELQAAVALGPARVALSYDRRDHGHRSKAFHTMMVVYDWSNGNTEQPTKTILPPNFGGEVQHMRLLPTSTAASDTTTAGHELLLMGGIDWASIYDVQLQKPVWSYVKPKHNVLCSAVVARC